MKNMMLKNRVYPLLMVVLLISVFALSACSTSPEPTAVPEPEPTAVIEEPTAVPEPEPTAVIEEPTAVPEPAEEETVEEAPAPEINAHETAVLWLNEQQNEDGGFGSFAITSTVAGTLDGMLAIGSDGDIAAAADYLADNVEETAVFASTNGGSAGKVVLALTIAGENPADFGGHDFVIDITNALSVTGQYAPDAFNQSLAMVGLTAVGETVPVTATQWLIDQQAADGSWDDGFGTTQNADATAMAVLGLLAANEEGTAPSIISALDFFAVTQLPTGGWEYGTGYGENANSTALVMQALTAWGEDVTAVDGTWAIDGTSLMSVLLGWQGESGAFQADFGEGPMDNLYATVQSLPALR